jgi:glycosyltransferase involved in cell wall biosynthesis
LSVESYPFDHSRHGPSFPVTCLLDCPAPSETFIRRELDLLRQRGWPLTVRMLKGAPEALPFTWQALSAADRGALLRAAGRRLRDELPRSPVTAARMLRRLPQAASLLHAVRQDGTCLLHAQFAGITADLAALAAQAAGLPWSCAVHARDVFAAPPPLRFRRLRRAAAITACSQQAANAVTDCGIPSEKVRVIHHGLPLARFPFDPAREGQTLFTACRLETKKGIDTLLHACAILARRGTRFSCVIAGSGPLERDLYALARRLALGAAVTFIGWLPQEEIRARLMTARAVALPSRRAADGDRDGIANILVEAMAIGTPIVTTEAGAAGEIIADRLNGRLVPPDDPDALAGALDELLRSKDTAHVLSRAARATVESRFDAEKNIAALEAFFAAAAGREKEEGGRMRDEG